MIQIIKNEYYEAKISTYGAEMISLKSSNGTELLWQNPDGKYWSDHAPVLFPLCGAIKDKKAFYKGKSYDIMMHGFAMRSEFSVAEKKDSEVTLVLNANEETKKAYPFDFTLTLNYRLDGNKVIFSATVKNDDKEILPYSFGWHPGFNLPCDEKTDIEDYAVKFDNKNEVTWVRFYFDFDTPNEYLPYKTPNSEYKFCEEEIYKYDTMIFKDTGSKITLAADGRPFSLDMTWTDNLPVLCLWKSEHNDAKFICIEPWTHDTLRGEKSNHWEERDAHRLNPGESEKFEYTLKFSF